MKPDKTLSALLGAACRLAEGRSLALLLPCLVAFVKLWDCFVPQFPHLEIGRGDPAFPL